MEAQRGSLPRPSAKVVMSLLALRGLWRGLTVLFADQEDATTAWQVKRDVFARSYDEVLAALKHQDDKLNRTLTAIAFLTAAGVTLFARPPGKAFVRFPESATSVRAVFFVIFLAATVFALILALAAIGPSTPYPSRSSRSRRPRSLIFYALIKSDPDWDRYIEAPAPELVEKLARNFHKEAFLISRRVVYKVARSRESGAFVQLAILALSLLGIFSIGGFSLAVRWWISCALIGSLLLAPFLDRREMSMFEFGEAAAATESYVYLALIVVCAGILLGRAPSAGQHWPAMYYALAAFTCSRAVYAHKTRVARVLLGGSAVAGVILVLLVAIP
jgi:hypothetical protein